MKKIFLSIICLGAMLSSCDMDLQPSGVLDDETALVTVTDCERYRNGFYTNLRALTGGAYISYPEIQMDEFFGTIINGNRHGSLSNGVILSGDSDFESIWGGCYGAISSVNFFLEKVQAIYELETTTAEDRAKLDRFVGEAKFARAYYYYYLVDHFCNSYTNVNPAEAMGLPLNDTYNPTSDNSTYLSRSSLEDTFKFIEKDAKDAYDAMIAFEETNKTYLVAQAIYLNSNVVKAFQCRIAFLKGDYQTAKTLAEELINDGLYTITLRKDYAKMWTEDTGSEIIFSPYGSQSEGAPATGTMWLSALADKADYIPTPFVAEELYVRNDIRNTCFLKSRDLVYESELFTSPSFTKFPGNPALGVNTFQNRTKPFRLSETYLILAESCFELDDEDGANDALNAIRSNRILRFNPVDYSGTELRDQIRLERQRELIGEGFRMSDLRRWKLGFARTNDAYAAPYAAAGDIVVKAGLISYKEDDYRYVWPIPSSEIQVNPQMKGQQNPGY